MKTRLLSILTLALCLAHAVRAQQPLKVDTSGNPTTPLNLTGSNIIGPLAGSSLPATAVQTTGNFTLGGTFTFSVAPVFTDAAGTRAALGLGSVATLNTGTSAGNVVALDGSGKLPAVDGSQLTALPATVPLLADLGSGTPIDLNVNGAILQNGNLLAYQGALFYPGGSNQLTDNGGNLYYDSGTPVIDAEANLYSGNGIRLSDSSGNVYDANGNIVISSAGTISSQNNLVADGTYLYGDASNLFNVPPPAGLSLNGSVITLDYAAYGGDAGLYTSVNNQGDFYVGSSGGATQLLSSPNTLGPLDGTALTVGGQQVFGNMNGQYFDSYGNANNVDNANYAEYADSATDANYANNAFNDFFQGNGHNTDTSLPGDGTFSLGNGILQSGDGVNVQSAGSTGSVIFVIDGTNFYPHVTAGVLTFTSTP